MRSRRDGEDEPRSSRFQRPRKRGCARPLACPRAACLLPARVAWRCPLSRAARLPSVLAPRACCCAVLTAHSPVRISQDRPRAGRSCGSRPSRPSAPLRTELAEAIVTELREPGRVRQTRARGTGGRAGERASERPARARVPGSSRQPRGSSARYPAHLRSPRVLAAPRRARRSDALSRTLSSAPLSSAPLARVRPELRHRVFVACAVCMCSCFCVQSQSLNSSISR